MQALVLYPDGHYQLEEAAEPQIGQNPFAPDDVLIQVAYCGICGSDVHGWHVQEGTRLAGPERPIVGGHEMCGTVLAVGPAVTRYKPGDRVVGEIVVHYCGECVNCRAGKINICVNTPPMAGRIHYTVGGLWVDYHLMSTIPGLFVLGEANFSDHGANRLGASALMQGLADGYFIIPYTMGHYLASAGPAKVAADAPEAREAADAAENRIRKLMSIRGKRTVNELHRRLGLLLWDKCGMARNEQGLREALEEIPAIREEFWKNVNIPGEPGTFNQVLERAMRVADFMEFAELMVRDALERRESCGGHFREEFQTEDGEALRDDEHFAHVAAWEYNGPDAAPRRHVEPLVFEAVKPSQRSYK